MNSRLSAQALEIMDTLVMSCSDTLDVRDAHAVSERIKGSVSSKQYGYEDLLCPLIAEACIGVCPKNPVSFNTDNVRILIPYSRAVRTASAAVSQLQYERSITNVLFYDRMPHLASHASEAAGAFNWVHMPTCWSEAKRAQCSITAPAQPQHCL
jgi:hypothetical protein